MHVMNRFPTFSALVTSKVQDATTLGSKRVSAPFVLNITDEERLRRLHRDRDMYVGTCNPTMVRVIDERIAQIHAKQ